MRMRGHVSTSDTFLVCLALALAAGPAWAGGLGGYSRAASGAPFLRLGVGARAVAMGEAYAAVVDDAGAVYWNPAAMVEVEKRSALLMHAEYLDTISMDYAAYAHNLDRYGAAGGAIHYLSAGTVTETDIAGVEQGNFNPYDLALVASYAYRFRETPRHELARNDDDYDEDRRDEWAWINGYAVGISAKYVRSQLSRSRQTATFDAGILSPAYRDGKIKLALVVQNMGGVLRFDKESEVLPFAVRSGAAFRLGESVTLAGEAVLPRESSSYGALGIEYRRTLRVDWAGAARLGFNSRSLGEVSGLSGLSSGIGLGYLKYSLDYAFVPWGSLGSHHQASLTVKF